MPLSDALPPSNHVAMRVVEIIDSFIVAALLFVWYRPPWLRALYLKAERKMAWIYYVIVVTFLLGLLWGGVSSVLGLIWG